jgi:hypothetical protein
VIGTEELLGALYAETGGPLPEAIFRLGCRWPFDKAPRPSRSGIRGSVDCSTNTQAILDEGVRLAGEHAVTTSDILAAVVSLGTGSAVEKLAAELPSLECLRSFLFHGGGKLQNW